MANITEDLAWMQRMAKSTATRERDLAYEQALERQAEEAAMQPYYQDPCGFCGHKNHSVRGFGALWCQNESCLCGVDSCPHCGNHERHAADVLFRCAKCGHQWWPSAIA